jgi:hypothetical protein
VHPAFHLKKAKPQLSKDSEWPLNKSWKKLSF